MAVALERLHISFPRVSTEPRGVLVAAGALALFAAGAWGVVGSRLASAQQTPAILYSAAPVPVGMMDMRERTVAEIIAGLPVGLKFELLLKRTGLWQRVEQGGTYTVFVPLDNYFDYINLPSYTRYQERALAENHILPGKIVEPGADGYLSVGGGFATRGYYAKNGVVYLISGVLVP